MGEQTRLLDFLVGEHKTGRKFSNRGEGANHPWMKLAYRDKEILIKKMFHFTNKENIKKTKEVLRISRKLLLQLLILWNCASKNSIGRPQGQCKKWSRIGKKWFLQILEILYNYYDIELRERIKTLRTMFRMPDGCIMFFCFSLDFFCFCSISRRTVILIK